MKQIDVVEKITKRYPSINLIPGDTYYWSPQDKTVYYHDENQSIEGIWALLHETGHALLEHEQYHTDIGLLKMEMQAWERAEDIIKQLDVTMAIDEDHVQDCLDSYRDWLHKRSLCPDCHLSGIQVSDTAYTCVFCHKKWHVSADRFCRPYRKSL